MEFEERLLENFGLNFLVRNLDIYCVSPFTVIENGLFYNGEFLLLVIWYTVIFSVYITNNNTSRPCGVSIKTKTRCGDFILFITLFNSVWQKPKGHVYVQYECQMIIHTLSYTDFLVTRMVLNFYEITMFYDFVSVFYSYTETFFPCLSEWTTFQWYLEVKHVYVIDPSRYYITCYCVWYGPIILLLILTLETLDCEPLYTHDCEHSTIWWWKSICFTSVMDLESQRTSNRHYYIMYVRK